MKPSEPKHTLETVAQSVEELRALLDERARNDDAARLAIRQLHAEMEHYKQDFLFQSQKNLLLDLLAFHDSLCWFRDHVAQPDITPETVSEGVQYLLDEILELLYRQDVVPVESARSFDRTLQKAVQVVWTADPENDQNVYRVIRRGFLRSGRILRPEEVVVWRCRSAGQDEAMPAEPGSDDPQDAGSDPATLAGE